MTVRELAEQQGRNYGTLRKERSLAGIPSERTIRRGIIVRLMDKGSPAEIAEFLRLYHGSEITTAAVSMVIRRWREAADRKRGAVG